MDNINKRNGVRVVRVHRALVASLRFQTLLILEFECYRFETISDRTDRERAVAASIFRDAIAVLDAIGWSRPTAEPASLLVALSAGHAEQLRRRVADLEQAITDRAAYGAADAKAHEDDAATVEDLVRLLALLER